MTGVSTNIGTSFVRPAVRVGDVLHAKAVLTGIGAFLQFIFSGSSGTYLPCFILWHKQLAYTRVDFAGELVAYGCEWSMIGLYSR